MGLLKNKLSVAEGRNGVLEKEKGELEVKVADITSDVKSETGVIGKCNYFSLISWKSFNVEFNETIFQF